MYQGRGKEKHLKWACRLLQTHLMLLTGALRDGVDKPVGLQKCITFFHSRNTSSRLKICIFIYIYLTNRIILAESCEVQVSSSTSSKPVASLRVAPGFYWRWWVNGREQEDEDTVTWSSSSGWETAALSVLSPPGEPAEWFLSTFILFYTNPVIPLDFLHLANALIWAKNGEFIYSFIHW